jgi:hypothetical protein
MVSQDRGTGSSLVSRAALPATLWTPDEGMSTVVVAQDDRTKQNGLFRVDMIGGQATKLLESERCYSCARQNEGSFSPSQGRETQRLCCGSCPARLRPMDERCHLSDGLPASKSNEVVHWVLNSHRQAPQLGWW